MNGRLESRPTGRLESLPYESARLVFSCGEKFPCLLGWPQHGGGHTLGIKQHVWNYSMSAGLATRWELG
jgi:hypothetical protein